MPLTVTFVRHGESTANVDRIFANRASIPGDLTSTGIAQAEALANALADAGITCISSSPLPRALQTARIIAKRLRLPIEVTDALREYDVGEDEGFPYSGEHAWRWDRYEAVQRAWREGDSLARHPGGESLADVQRRFRAWMDTLPSRHGDRDAVLAVGHGGLFHAALPALLPLLPADIATRHPLRHGDQVTVIREHGGWRCARWAGMAFPQPQAD